MRKLFTNIWEFLQGIPQGLKNLMYYLRVVWSDRDWDECYIEYILLAKYKKHYANKTMMPSVNQDEYDQALRICINILQRRKDDWYTEMWYDREGQDLQFEWMDSDQSPSKQLEINGKIGAIFRRRYWADMRDSVEQRDWKVYCKLVEKYHNHWWD